MELIPTKEIQSALWEYLHIHATQELANMLSTESILEYHRTKALPQIDISSSKYSHIFTQCLPIIYGRARQVLGNK